MSGLDKVANAAIKNQDNIIEHSPISLAIQIFKKMVDGPIFSYPTAETQTPVTSKAIIKYNPTRSFLKQFGVFWEEGDSTSIIAFFKSTDNVERGDIIKTFMLDKNTTSVEQFQCVSIKTRGYSQTQNKLWVLSPWRG